MGVTYRNAFAAWIVLMGADAMAQTPTWDANEQWLRVSRVPMQQCNQPFMLLIVFRARVRCFVPTSVCVAHGGHAG
jgi:hypothetical protein